MISEAHSAKQSVISLKADAFDLNNIFSTVGGYIWLI